MFTLLVAISFPYNYDYPNYKNFQEQILNQYNDAYVDFSELNNGEWKIACLFGGYTNPSYSMKKHGNIGWIDYLYQPMKAWPVIRLAQVEEHEALIAYVDLSNHVHFIHFHNGMSKTHRTIEHVEKCTINDQPLIKTPWR